MWSSFVVCRYDHLARVLSRLLTERPLDAVDILEDFSKQEKSEKFFNRVDTIVDKPDKSTETKLAEIQRSLYVVSLPIHSILFYIRIYKTN